MSMKSKVIAATATADPGRWRQRGGDISRPPRPPRRAVTTASTCSAVSSARTSTPETSVLDVLRQGAKVGQPVILFPHQQQRPGGGLHRLLPGQHVGLLSRPAWCRPRWRCTTAARWARFVTCANGVDDPGVRAGSTRLTAWTAACCGRRRRHPRPRTRACPSSRVGVLGQDGLDPGPETTRRQDAAATTTCR